MMKVMKKISAFLVCLCMMVCMVPVVAHAASGELRFSDPSTTVGATFEVTAKMSADYSIESGEATLTYDTDYLRFVSGKGATDNGGTITLTGTADGATEMNWSIEFQALEEGTTKIEISDVSAVDTDGDAIDITRGNSAITIGPGDPSLIQDAVPEGEQVEVNGTIYTISGEISELLIPNGFVASEMNYNGTTYPAVSQESSGVVALYLLSSEDEGEFFIYDVETNTFLPFCQISISADRYIIILSDEEKTSELTDYLQQTTMTIDGKEFVAWQNVKESDYYVVYALNSDGIEGYYQYDTVDATYQRYTPEEVVVEEAESTELVDQFLALVEDNLLVCILGAVFAILFLFLLLIIVSIKLRHRNIELDDLCDEYGIDEDEEEEEPVKVKKEKKGLFGKKKSKDDDFDDFDEDDFDEDDFDEDDFDDDFDDEDDYEEDDFDDDFDDEDDYEEDDFEDEDDIDDLDELLNARVKKPAPRKSAPQQTARPVAKQRTASRASKPAVKQSAAGQGQKPAVKPAAPRPAAPQPVAPKVGKPQQKVGHSDLDDTFKMDLIDLD